MLKGHGLHMLQDDSTIESIVGDRADFFKALKDSDIVIAFFDADFFACDAAFAEDSVRADGYFSSIANGAER